MVRERGERRGEEAGRERSGKGQLVVHIRRCFGGEWVLVVL